MIASFRCSWEDTPTDLEQVSCVLLLAFHRFVDVCPSNAVIRQSSLWQHNTSVLVSLWPLDRCSLQLMSKTGKKSVEQLLDRMLCENQVSVSDRVCSRNSVLDYGITYVIMKYQVHFTLAVIDL